MGLMSRFSSSFCRLVPSCPFMKAISPHPSMCFWNRLLCSNAPLIEKPVPHETLMEDLMKCSSLEDQMRTLSSSLRLTPEDLKERQKIVTLVYDMLDPFFENYHCQMYGSSVNGLGLKGCDIDMCFNTSVEFKDQMAPTFDDSDIPTLEDVLAGKVSKAYMSQMSGKDQLLFIHTVFLDFYKDSQTAPLFINAYVPIIRFNHDGYDIKVDLSSGNRSALVNTKLLNLYCKLDDRVIPFLSTIRYWAKHVGLVGKGLMFNSYCLTLMALCYLQQRRPPLIPTVEHILSFTPQMDEWKAWWVCSTEDDHLSLMDKLSPSSNTETLGELLRGFFFYYLSFDFAQVICPLHGNSLSREHFLSSEYSKKFRFNTICVQDPIKLTHNVANLVDYKHCKKFAREMFSACDLWQNRDIWLPNSEKWGLVSLFGSQGDLPVCATEKLIELTVPLSYADESLCRHTAHTMLHIFKHGLLFDCNSLQETEVTDNSTFEMPGTDTGKKLLMVFQCIVHDNIWMGRSNVTQTDIRPDSFDNLLDYEREVSLMICGKTKEFEKKFDFKYLCKLFLCKTKDGASLHLTMSSRSPVTPVLGVFLREFIPRTWEKLHTNADSKCQNAMNSM